MDTLPIHPEKRIQVILNIKQVSIGLKMEDDKR